MRRALRSHPVGAIAVDGPLGPYHVVKPGAIDLAADIGLSLLPITTVASKSWSNGRRWDRMEVPYPFSRVVFAAGEPITVQPVLLPEDRRALEDKVRQARQALEQHTDGEGRMDHQRPADGDPRKPDDGLTRP